jgi:xylulose-5-phosphate/fructose-6-phosphate phosphoketolase
VETGPLATSWHSNKFLNPATDGAVLPILHLNGYKIANPTILARIDADELHSLFVGYGYKPYLVEGDDPATMHQLMASTLDNVFDEIRGIQNEARERPGTARPRWPMIILKTPKGWTGPKEVDGLKTEGFWRSHQVPFAEMATKPEHIKLLESWMKSYQPERLSDEHGALRPEIAALAPSGERRMSANPHANGGLLMHELDLPDIANYAVKVEKPGRDDAEATAVMAEFLRDIVRANEARKNFRVFGPDETASNRLSHVFEVTNRAWDAHLVPYDDHLARQSNGGLIGAHLPGLARRLSSDRPTWAF